MRESCHLLEKVHDELAKAIRPGISTWEIDHLGEEMIRSFGCTPNFLHYNGYPASICVSVNDEVVHGIPSKKRILREGDIVSLDAGLIYKGYHSDAARTHAVGEISPEAQKLIDVTRQSFFEGIKMAKAGNHLYDISAAIGNYAESFGYGVVRDDIQEAQFTRPMLTTVSLPKEDMGKFALYLLLDRLKGGHSGIVRMELEGRLMIRNSCSSVEDSMWSDYCI